MTSTSEVSATQINAFAKMLDRVDLTPETLAKTFKDVGESPEKLRALLNLWFTPWFKPKFTADRDYAVAWLRDVEFLGHADHPPGQLPYRMFDIETGNLVEFPAIGVRGQYCMLSHRWKGVELTLSYIKEARKKELERSRETPAAEKSATRSHGKKSDVELVLEQCRLDLEEQESLIAELVSGHDESGEEGTKVDVGHLLDRRLKARAAEDNLGWAKDGEAQARSKLRFAQMEQRVFSNMFDEMQEQVDEKMHDHLGDAGRAKGNLQSSIDDVGTEVVREVQAELKKAEANLKDAKDTRDAVLEDIAYFQQHRHLRDALDELVSRLQRWKSAIKLDRAIQEADRIFKTKLFQHREKCYLWTDTCCIDKANGGELSESLSLMGDWYADAEYTLVQLDTPYSEADAVTDWDRFVAEKDGKGGIPETQSNLQVFGDIRGYDPEWSTRAWTLQELVMSKTTFYTNSSWAPLSRPVEDLGYFYYLIPFIALYTEGDTKNIYRYPNTAIQGFWSPGVLEEILVGTKGLSDLEYSHWLKTIQSPFENNSIPNGNSSEALRVKIAQQLIVLLAFLGVKIPGNLIKETATSEMARAVFLASAELTAEDNTSHDKRGLLIRLQERLPEPDLTRLPTSLSEQETQEELAQHAVNFVLQCLVAETEELVVADREYIADFGRVQQLTTWQEGTERTGFSASSVLEISGKRKATVATDRAYALMGVLGVRFPTFSAEGYAKALARLLDEVVIARNDVSVFNWTGMEMGSPIRGRSMYPSSHTAYGNPDDRGKRYNLLLFERVQDKVQDVVATYRGVIQTLRAAIDVLKERERKDLPFEWIDRIVQLILSHSFRELRPQQEGFGKIVGYVREYCRKERERLAKENEAKERREQENAAKMTETGTPPPDKGFALLKKTAMPSVTSMSSLSASSLLGSKSSASSKKDEEDKSAPGKKGSKFGLGKSVKAPSFGFSKKGGSSTQEPEPTVTEVPVTPESQAATDLVDATPDPPPPYEEVEAPPAQPSWQSYYDEVMEYLSIPSSDRASRALPADVQSIQFELDGDQKHPAKSTTTHYGSQAGKRALENGRQGGGLDTTISPNPIIVNNSGIEALFDIQRIVVTMIDPDKLRRQIAKAAGPHDIISGWCSVSTGFARVVTSFACERHVLECELDVVKSVEARVLREQDKDASERRGARLLKTLSVTNAKANKKIPDGEGQENGEKTTDEDTAPQPAHSEDGDSGNTEEERRVSRMIEFIQEPQLELVAGEWVLARFSGVPAANWFLCHLELGASSPGVLYGRRIAAGAIDFRDSTPEPGLVGAWQTYMERKKRKMCYILDDYLLSRTTAREGEEKLKEGSNLARQGLDMAVKGLRAPVLERAAAAEGVEGEGDSKDQGKESGDESDAEGDGEDVLGKVLAQGKLAAKALGEYTVLTVAEKLFEMRADHLDKTLATAVLKRTPKNLRTAVENLDENKSFLPAMFHSSTRVHMF
ncbi:hypothetical protein C7999DRAFT_14442 [Corynascus novoguineensis]|uniref:Heterokaryon incompatibility domain-containing protein n=1 Tax=Corynascus novoguineensis TaxID=1126955 RepID=A0AAN7CV93_9PEZI|nr:hypothetical protein C7999DRAFT_14442 [Corynascus novoguineensis]